MSIVLGFGKTEKDVEAALEEEIRNYVASRCQSDYFSQLFVADIMTWLHVKSLESRENADVYKSAADHPERYSYFYDHVVADASYLVFILSFHHINRRHAFSPDGWALMQSERLFYIRHGE